MNYARLVVFIALAGCQTSTLSPGASVPTGVRDGTSPDIRGPHVYVAVETATHHTSIERFHLVGGIPQGNPDHVFDGYTGPIAVSAYGPTLYAFGYLRSPSTIYAFVPRNDQPDRTLKIPGPGRCGVSSGEVWAITAVAADPAGYLFAAISTYAEAPSHRRTAIVPAKSGGVPCNGVAVFAPDANGKVQPVQTIPLGRHTTITGIAVDPADNLYITEDPYTIAEYTNAVTNPQRSRVFHVKSPAHVSSIAADDEGNVYISNINYGYQTGWIDRYAPSAKGNGPPTSQILFQGSSLHFLLATAVRRRELFAADDFTRVDLYHSRHNGAQSPFYSFPTTNVSALAVGP